MMRARVRQHAMPLVGIGYLVVIAILVALSVAVYAKAMPWQRSVAVSLQTARPGLELHPHSDVKLQGVRVGEVRRITSDGRSATVELALEPGKTELIPRNVDAAILPKTLFGEKYVDLRSPARPSAEQIKSGDVIRQSTTSVEIGELFTNLGSLLRTMKPERLSLALNSLADTLEGRGDQLGETIELVDRYLGGFNPHLEQLTQDIRLFAKTADIYAAAAPDTLRTLADGAAISRELLVPEEQAFAEFLDATIRGAGKATDVLRRNADTMIKLSDRSEAVLALLAEYSSSFPCTVHAFAEADRAGNDVVGARGPFVEEVVELYLKREPYRYPQDLPSNPGSDANNANLPKPIRSWDPHCPHIPARLRTVEDASPYSQLSPGQNAVPPERPGDRRASRGLASLLVTPMLADREVRGR